MPIGTRCTLSDPKTMHHEPDSRRKARLRNSIGQTIDLSRYSHAHRRVEDLLCHLNEAVQASAPTRQHDAA